MEMHEGIPAVYTETGRVNREAVRKGYEQTKNDRIDKAASALAKALADLVTAAVEEDRMFSIDSAVCMVMSGILFPEGIEYKWQSEFVKKSWAAVQQAAEVERERHGAD